MSKEYPELLARVLTGTIHFEEEHEHFISILAELERRSNDWTLAEAKLAELLTLLIEEFEDRNYQLKAATPAEVLQELMDSNNLQSKDLLDVFGAESTVSAVLNAQREMTRDETKMLSERFHLSPEVLF